MSDRLVVARRGSKVWEKAEKTADVMGDWGQRRERWGTLTYGLLQLSRLEGPHRVFVAEKEMIPFVKSCDDWLHRNAIELGYWIDPSFEVFSDG